MQIASVKVSDGGTKVLRLHLLFGYISLTCSLWVVSPCGRRNEVYSREECSLGQKVKYSSLNTRVFSFCAKPELLDLGVR